MLQKGLGRSAGQNRGLGGDIRLKSGPYLVLFVLLHGGRPGSGRPRTFLENILPQERYQLVSDLYLQCLPCATQIHTLKLRRKLSSCRVHSVKCLECQLMSTPTKGALRVFWHKLTSGKINGPPDLLSRVAFRCVSILLTLCYSRDHHSL